MCVSSKFREVGVELEQAIIRWIITNLMPRDFLVSAYELDQIFPSAKRQAPKYHLQLCCSLAIQMMSSAVRD